MHTMVVSGADRNVGYEFAKQFLEMGWQVFAGRFDAGITLLDELKKEHPDQLTIVPMDVSSDASVEEAAQAISAMTNTVDVLIHNAAAFGGRNGFFDEDPDLAAYTIPFNTNALGMLRLVKAFLPLMQSGMKRICAISSEAGVVSVSHREDVSSYGMSKTALNMAMRILHNHLQPMGFCFRLYHPGWVRSRADANGVHHGKFWPAETVASAIPQFLEERSWEDRLVLIDNEGAAWPF